jgi:hypothetical protein
VLGFQLPVFEAKMCVLPAQILQQRRRTLRAHALSMTRLGFRVQSLGFRVQGLGFRV